MSKAESPKMAQLRKMREGKVSGSRLATVDAAGRKALLEEAEKAVRPPVVLPVRGQRTASPSIKRSGAGRPRGPETVPLPVRVPPALLERLDAAVLKRGGTRSEVVRAILDKVLP